VNRLSKVTRTVLGLLLIAVAVLKFYGMSISAAPRVGWFAQPWLQLSVAVWEVVLGVWLLSGSHYVGSWFSVFGTLLAFAGVSGYLGITGVPSCGCLGAVDVSPWWRSRLT